MTNFTFIKGLESASFEFAHKGWHFAASACDAAIDKYGSEWATLASEGEYTVAEDEKELDQMLRDKGMSVYAAFEEMLGKHWDEETDGTDAWNTVQKKMGGMAIDAKCALEEAVPLKFKAAIGF